MSRSRLLLATLPTLVAALLLPGCGSSTTDEQRLTSPRTATTRAPSSSSYAPEGTTIPTEYDEKADARADVRAALAASRRDGKPVLLDFGADWCPDCRVLEKLYRVPAVSKDLLSAYHLVLVNVGEFDRNIRLALRYVDLRTSGIPALAVVRDGKTVYASDRGQFANARTMKVNELQEFLRTWAG